MQSYFSFVFDAGRVVMSVVYLQEGTAPLALFFGHSSHI